MEPFVREMRELYQRRRDIAVQALQDAGWPVNPPRGTFYLWAPVPAAYTSTEFVSYILEQTGVVLTPGRGFGEYGEGYFRIALTVDEGRLKEAMARIKDAVKFS
jgi:LL-diaminopimelate aminotransferase